MDARTDSINQGGLSSEVLIEFIDELREAGYKIGISQYIAAQDLILALTAQGETLDKPERLKTLLGPIFCSSPIEQEDFQQRFERWIDLIGRTSRVIERADVKAKVLSEELEKIWWRSRQLILILIAFILAGISLPILLERFQQEDNIQPPSPSPTPTLSPTSTPSPTPKLSPTPIPSLTSTPSPTPKLSPTPIPSLTSTPSPTPTNPDLLLDWQTTLTIFLLVPCVAFLTWRLWWLRRAHLFLQRYGTTRQPELQKISINSFEQNLFPSTLFINTARNLRQRIRIPSNELDVDKTIDASLRQGGWLTPVYGSHQIIPEYLFLIDRASYRDHQFKFIEEILARLRYNGVFITSYYFDGDPRICFPSDSLSSPQKLQEIAAKYSQHRLVIVLDTEKLFSAYIGELEPWVSQIASWDKRAILTPKPVENWGYQELELAQQFIILPATPKGVQVLSQVLHQGAATYILSEGAQIPLPEPLRVRPYHWIDRNPPISEQIDALLISLQEYLGKDNFYWLCACAVFPELHWNITIYLGNVLRTEEGHSLLEVCSLTNLARLPWFRYSYMPDWLRTRLISSLTSDQERTIRTVFQDLLVTAVQGSVGRLQLEVARQHHNFLPKLANPMLHLLSRRSSEGSPLRDYMFLSFMTGQPKLAIEVPETFNRLLQRQKRFYWLIGIGACVTFAITLFFGKYSILPSFNQEGNGSSGTKPEPTINEPVAKGQGNLLRTIRVTSGQWQVVRSVTVSPDGKIIASSNDKGEVQLWDLSTGNLLYTLSGQSGQLQSVIFSPDQKIIASASVNGSVRLWSLSGKLIAQFNSSEGVYSLAFSPSGQMIVSGHSGGIIKLWNLDGKLVRSIKAHSGTVVSLAISTDGKFLASRSFVSISSDTDKDIKLWDLSTGKLIRSFTAGEVGGVNSIAISPDGRILAGYSELNGEAVRLWRLDTGEVIGTLNVGINRPHAVAFSPDGKTLAVGGFADQIQIWDLLTQNKVRIFSSGVSGYHTYSLIFTNEGKTIVSAGSNGSGGVIMVWEVN